MAEEGNSTESVGSDLNEKQKKFCEEYLSDFNATLSLIRSGVKAPQFPKGFYVYFLINSVTNHIFYVGKGKGKRSKLHLSNFYKRKEPNPAKALAIRETIETGGQVIDFVFADNLNEMDAFRIERNLIRSFPELTNIANGSFHRSEITILRAKNGLASMISEEEMLSRPPIKGLEEIDGKAIYYMIKEEYQKIIDGELPIREIIHTFKKGQPSTVEVIRW